VKLTPAASISPLLKPHTDSYSLGPTALDK
jgi:hypothetical protein